MNTTPLEAFIFEKMAATRIPGLSIALVQDDHVAYARGFGLAEIATGKAATPDTLFGAASITKSFIAIAILQLAEKGLLKVDDPVDRHLPYPIRTHGESVTLSHLLTHTAGTPALGYIEAVLRHAHQIGGTALPIGKPEDVLTFMQGGDAWTETKPGERWFYFNEGYVILGLIIEKLTGQPYHAYIRDKILKPLGMTRSFFTRDEVTADDDVAVPYVLPKEGEPRAGRNLHGILGGDAALITTANDLGRYVLMLTRGAKGILSPASYKQLVQPRIAMPMQPMPQWLGDSAAAKPAQYGFGVSISEDFFGEPLIGHGGSLIIATSHFAYLPRSKVGVAILANGNGYATAQFARTALAMLLGKDPQQLSFARMDKALSDLTGEYETFRGTVRTRISRAGDFLRMEWVGGDQPPGPTIFVPERVDGKAPRFFTYADGARLPVEFRHTAGGVELVYERYKFKRVGAL